MVSSSSVNDAGAVTTRNLTLQRPIHSRSIGDRNRKGAKRGDEARRYAHRPVVKVRSPYAYDRSADSTPCRARIPRDVGPVFHGMPGHRSTASRAG
jgi:hypothetical protein